MGILYMEMRVFMKIYWETVFCLYADTSVSTVLVVLIAALLGVIVCALRRREVKE